MSIDSNSINIKLYIFSSFFSQVMSGPRRHPQVTQGGYSSDGDTDEE